MSLSNLTADKAAALAPVAFLNAIGAFGRPLREGASQLEEQQRNKLERSRVKVLKEVARESRFPEDDVKGLWEYQAKFGDMSIRKLSEAVAETQLPQLLRFGVQNFLFDGYASVPTIYADLVRVVQSGGAEELYAPLYGVELPQTLAPGQEFGDSRLQGLDVHVPNQKKGRMLTVERELVDDDRTGQIVTRAGQMGERMRYVEEEDVINAITGATYNSTLKNVNPSPSGLTAGVDAASLKAADIALEEMLDPLGNKMLVMPDTLLVAVDSKFVAAQLLQSALQPSVPGASGQTASSASSGGTGWTMTMNPLQGLYNLKVSRFLATSGGLNSSYGKAFLLEAKKSIVFQDRDPLEVAQEATNAGASFERDVYRYRVRRRYAAAVIESRYLYEIC